MVTLSKARLVEKLHNYGLGYSKEELLAFVNDLLVIMEEELCSDQNIQISKFGTFEVINKVARLGRNPKTKEEVIIARRKTLRFRPSPKLTDAINTTHDGESNV